MTSSLRHQHTVMLIPDRIATADDWSRLPDMIVELGVIGVYFDAALWAREPGPDQYVARETLRNTIAALEARGRACAPHIALPTTIVDGVEQYTELRRMLSIATDLFGSPPAAVYCDGAERYQWGSRAYVAEILIGLGGRPDLIECSAERECLDLITSVGNVDVPAAADAWSMSGGMYHAHLMLHLHRRWHSAYCLENSGLLNASGYAMPLGWIGGVQRRVDEPMRVPYSIYWVDVFRSARDRKCPVRARMTIEGLARTERVAFREAMEGRT